MIPSYELYAASWDVTGRDRAPGTGYRICSTRRRILDSSMKRECTSLTPVRSIISRTLLSVSHHPP